MTLKNVLLISFFVTGLTLNAQQVRGVYKISRLLQRIGSDDTLYVVNFWATWCKPCVQELPAFDSLTAITNGTKIKVLLVCLDFKDELEKRVQPFLSQHNIQTECVLLDEVNGNDYIDLVSPSWSGAIPATLIKSPQASVFLEKKIKLADLEMAISTITKH